MDMTKDLSELIELTKDYLKIIGYNSSKKIKFRDEIDQKRTSIIHRISSSYVLGDKYINLKELVLNEHIKFSDPKCNIKFLKIDFKKLLCTMQKELITKKTLIKKGHNKFFTHFGFNMDFDFELDLDYDLTSDEEVSTIKEILDSPSMLKIRLVFEFIDLNTELFIHYIDDTIINDLLNEYIDEIKNNYNFSTTFVDVPFALKYMEEQLKLL